MSLTGTAFAWLLVVLTVAAFAGLVLAWPVLGRPRPGWLAARIGSLLLVNLLVLLMAAVQLNNRFLFFADWADLAGAVGGSPATSTVHRGGAGEWAPASPGPDVAAPRALQPLPAGRRVQPGVTGYQVTGPASGITAEVLVTLPPGYQPVDAATHYPVLETFSGYPSSPAQWVKTMRLQAVLAGQAARRVRPMLVVSPQLEVPAGADTECVNGPPGTPQLETWLTRDVPAWVATHFRTAAGPGSWATIGLSAGGWCAAMGAMLHPEQFGGAIVLGGYFEPQFTPGAEPYPPGSALARRYDLVALARRSPPPVSLWMETSHADPESYASSATLLRVARPPLSVTATVLQNAGHRIGIWQGLLPSALTWLGATLPGFAP